MSEEKIKHPFADVFGTPKHPDGTEYDVWEIAAELHDYWNRQMGIKVNRKKRK